MNNEFDINYHRIAEAIEYLKANFKEQPNLDEIAAKIHLSPFHFQRIFTEWAGTSPKKFLQFISIDYAKDLLRKDKISVSDTAIETGLSSTSRLHDLFVNIEGMTPAEYKNCGKDLTIHYSFSNCHFGKIIVASTSKGICHLAFYENEKIALQQLKDHFSNAKFILFKDDFQNQVVSFFNNEMAEYNKIKLHLKGTEFQLKVWQALLQIPFGQLNSYGSLANALNQSGASRAVGTAIGKNPVAYIIPCHRVIQNSGNLGGYMWGNTRKSALIGWEASQIQIE